LFVDVAPVRALYFSGRLSSQQLYLPSLTPCYLFVTPTEVWRADVVTLTTVCAVVTRYGGPEHLTTLHGRVMQQRREKRAIYCPVTYPWFMPFPASSFAFSSIHRWSNHNGGVIGG